MEEKPSYVVNTSKNRMNLVAIKKIDPYAKEIIDSSAHVAFYTFNSQKNEWEKTDVEGAFFIYKRNAEPFYSIFINNRLNTTSFVEPITNQLEIQSQPPFLLYRNERSRIRGFWFYSSQECNRISEFITVILNESEPLGQISSTTRLKNCNSNIFNMLSQARTEYAQNLVKSPMTSCNVLNFFASAKPTSFGFSNYQRVLSNSLSVEQLEKQQRAKTPSDNRIVQKLHPKFRTEGDEVVTLINRNCNESTPSLETSSKDTFLNSEDFKLSNTELCDIPVPKKCVIGNHIRDLFYKNLSDKVAEKQYISDLCLKPALMPPTMFEAGEHSNIDEKTCQINMVPLNYTKFVDAFSYLVQNDVSFMQKLHEAYLKSFSSLRH